MPGFTFRLYLESGDEAGTFTTATLAGWNAGDLFWDGDHNRWRIVSIAPAEGDLYCGLFVVEPARERISGT